MTFWDHLDELRSVIIRAFIAVVVLTAAAFTLKEPLFALLLAPTHSDFCTYRLIGADADFSLRLINTGLTEQFMAHMRTALYAGLLAASPYVLCVLFRFVSPCLYANERRLGTRLAAGAYLMFILGTLLNYFIVFPQRRYRSLCNASSQLFSNIGQK